MTSIHADIEALKELHEALVRYRHAQREVAGRGDEVIRVARAALAAKASRWQSQLEPEQDVERLEHIRRWQQRIDTEASEFQSTAGRFLDLLQNDLPRTEERLLDAVRSLEAARGAQAPGPPGA